MIKRLFVLSAIAVSFSSNAALALDLTVSITGLASNDDFDQGLLGIPLEAYGFSNGAIAFLGPPSFEDASFELAEPSGLVIIDLGQ